MTMQARGNLARYGAAVVFVALATGLRLLLEPLVGDNAPYALVFAAVAAAAWYGGLGPALLATVLGGASSYYLFVPPRHVVGAGGTLPGLVLFLLASSTVLGLSERLRRAWQRAEDAERRERQGRELVETTLRSIGDAVITTDAQGRVAFLNGVAERLTGWTKADAEGQPLESVFRVLDEQTREPAVNPARRVLEARQTAGTAKRTVLLARGGREEAIEDSAAPIAGPDGRSVGVVLVFRSVERARESERERERLSQRLESLIDNTPLAVVEWDGDFRVRRWSGEAEAVFGWNAEEVVGRRIDELRLVHEDDEAAVREVMARLLDPAGRYVVSRNRNRTRSGETRSCEWYNSMFHDEQGRLVAVLSLVLDVTERERLEATLRQSDRRKDEFLATLAHELRNPLAPMRNALEIMRLAGPDSGAAERARALIERQLAQMVRLIDDLLDVSRISLGRLELRRARVELSAVVSSAVETSRPLIEAGGHQLTVSLPREPVYVDGDLTRLAQVLVNLLNNAARYMEAGGRIRLSVRKQDDRAQLRVSDAGFGIPAEMLPHVFSMFTTGSRFGQRADGGLGIGLTLVKQLVELHGGTIEAHSEGSGRGSEFVVELPAVAAPPPQPRPPRALRDGRSGPRRRILVVDDNGDAAVSLATMLRMMGHETHTAHDGPSALEAAATRHPQIVLLDIGMPGMSGYEVAAHIRSSSWGREMTLIALTGWGQEEDRRRSREAGFDEHLVKPVHPELLAGVIAGLPAPAN